MHLTESGVVALLSPGARSEAFGVAIWPLQTILCAS